LLKVPCSANPIIKPAAPIAARSGPTLTSNIDKATTKPTKKMALRLILTIKSFKSAETLLK
jgi:hypothetical protein